MQKHSRNKSSRLWTSNYILVFTSSIFLFFAFNSLVPTLPIYIEVYEGISWAAGLPMTALTIGAVLIRPLTGWALDAYGRKIILFGGLLLFLLPTLTFIFMLPGFVLIALRFVQGLGWGIGNTAINTVASDVTPGERIGEGMSIFTANVGVSLAFAPVLSFWALERYSFPILFIAISVLSAISIILAVLVKFPEIEKKKEKIKLFSLEKNSLIPSLVILLYTVNLGSLISFVPVYAEKQGLPTGIFYTSLGITTLAVRPLVGYLVDRKGEWGFNLSMTVGTIGIAAAMIVIAGISTLPHLIIGGLLHGFGFGIIQPAVLARCLKAAPEENKGAANATYWTTFDIGVALGSAFWGLVVVWTGYYWMFIISVIPALCGFLLYLLKVTLAARNNLQEM